MDLIPQNRVELHIHINGAARPATILELSKKKGLPLPGDGSLRDLEDALKIITPTTLCDFLDKLKWVTPAFQGDLEAIERLTYELCEDKAKQGVCYIEMRCCPHHLLNENGSVTVRDVMRSHIKGIQRGEKDFNMKARLIISCVRKLPDIATEVVELADEFRNDGVVGIDLVGDETDDIDEHGEEIYNEKIIAAYQEAKRRGIHRTAHAGEAGPANGVIKAISLLAAERIGHGYRVVDDLGIYEKVLASKTHLETCPISSIKTGSVARGFQKHPIVRFAEDNVSFSISTDDPTITFSTLTDEYNQLYEWGLTKSHTIKANFNAVQASFLPEEEKDELLKKLKNFYSM